MGSARSPTVTMREHLDVCVGFLDYAVPELARRLATERPLVMRTTTMAASSDELEAMSYRELQAECKKRGLPAAGKKDALLQRLIAAEGSEGGDKGSHGALDFHFDLKKTTVHGHATGAASEGTVVG